MALNRDDLDLLDREWRVLVRGMLERYRDPAVHEDIWDYLEGRITRRMLRARPAFRAAYREEQQQAFGRPSDVAAGTAPAAPGTVVPQPGSLAAVMAEVTRRHGGSEQQRAQAMREILDQLPPRTRRFAQQHFEDSAREER